MISKEQARRLSDQAGYGAGVVIYIAAADVVIGKIPD